jgi:hypothetical protein
MRLVRVKSWCALVVLLGSVALGLSTAAIVPCSRLVSDGGADLRGTVALRVALLTSPGHDPHRPANPIVAWAAALDRALGAYWLAAPTHDYSPIEATPTEQTGYGGGSSQ